MSSDLAWEKGKINMDSLIRFSRDTLVFLRLKGSLTFKENCGELLLFDSAQAISFFC